MTFETFYLGCFLVGFLLSLISFLLQAADLSPHSHGDFHAAGGHAHGAGGGHAHVHLHLHHHHAGDAQGGTAVVRTSSGLSSRGSAVTKLNFSTFTAFLAWFGGTGYLLTRYTSLWTLLGLAIAGLMGIGGAWVVFWFLAKLVARDRTLDPADYDMVGVLGTVSSIVRSNGVGEMIFTQDGARKCAPIRSEDGTVIEKGAEVVITKYERGVGYVRRWSDLTGMPAGL
jgi:hypothetical protein